MANNYAVRELHPKPGSVRSVYASETIGLGRNQLIAQGIQERDQQNREVVVANVFGTVPPNQPQTDIINQLNRIIGDNQSDKQYFTGAINGWTELNQTTMFCEMILLNTNAVITEIPGLVTTLFTDSLFPVLMANGYKPLNYKPIDLASFGVHLYLFSNKTIQTTERTVRFISAANPQEVFTCPTYEAELNCLIRIDEEIFYETINRVFDPNNPSYGVIGLCAPVRRNLPSDTIARDITIGHITGFSDNLFANRFTYLVANDGLLCVSENFDLILQEGLMASLLKTDTYCLCEGSATVRSYKKRFGLKGLFNNQPYIECIIIVGEGVHHLLLELITDESVPDFSYVESHLRQHDMSVDICCLDSHQLSADLHSHRPNVGQQLSMRPVMKLREIGDHFIFNYKIKDTYIGDIVFSLFNNFYTTNSGLTDHWSVFICLDDIPTERSDYMYCTTIVVKYAHQYRQSRPLMKPYIVNLKLSKQNVKPIRMTADFRKRWIIRDPKRKMPWENDQRLSILFIRSIELSPINRFGNIGVNLIDRFRTIRKFRLIFPKDGARD